MHPHQLQRIVGLLFFLSIIAAVLWGWTYSQPLTRSGQGNGLPDIANLSPEQELENLQRLLAEASSKGKRPEQFLFFNLLNLAEPAMSEAKAPWLDQAAKVAAMLGCNSLPTVPTPERNGFYLLPRGIKVESSPPWNHRTFVVDAMDVLPPLPYQPGQDEVDAFRAYLREHKFDAADVGLSSMDEARFEWSNRRSPLAFLSYRFALAQYANQVAKRRQALEAMGPPGLHVTARSNAMLYDPTGLMPWGEDVAGQLPEISPAAVGWYLTRLRHAALANQKPMLWTIPVDDRLSHPVTLRRAFYLALAHGVKMFHFTGACPPSLAKGQGSIASSDQKRWLALQQLIHDAGRLEEFLFPAMTRPAEVAIYDSPAQRFHGHPDDEEERKALFLACRAAGHGIDLITPEEIRAGKHKSLRTIMIVGMHLERDVALLLRDWVRDEGGTLGGYAGGGLRDEFDQPLLTLNEVYGIHDPKLQRVKSMGRPKLEWPFSKPIDQFTWDFLEVKRNFPAMGCKLTFKTMKDVQIFARFQDGSPAIMRHDLGRGMGIFHAGYAASGFWQKALPAAIWEVGPEKHFPNHAIPTQWDTEIVDHVTVPTSEARWSVVTDNLMVETMVLEGPKGLVMIAINWSDQPQEAFLTVQYAGAKYNKASSMEQGPLKMTKMVDPNKKTAATYSFKLKVDVADAVVLEP